MTHLFTHLFTVPFFALPFADAAETLEDVLGAPADELETPKDDVETPNDDFCRRVACWVLLLSFLSTRSAGFGAILS